ncbi:hypothetical protein FVP74_07405 [Microbacterium saccharophilum]|uniref:Uncharacterized protein n=1 Tax=Microbacterium saccharophilum TaxID=1213358 RepID=A0A5C8I825_9MICO|nr:hypothetical protein [Microbacterium saccharophilum]TXK14380.1 hypothetical protein FVP74_07405 [Microbacterium saccharophilum]GEP49264.1 hypothetical protein MSA03_27720 [Microbacterium saccharophilum]
MSDVAGVNPAAAPPPPGIRAAENLTDWERFTATNLSRVTATAEKWQAGLAGFVAVVTSVFILKGPESFSKVAEPYSWWVVGLLALALIAMLGGLWLAQSAAAPVETSMTYAEFQAQNTATGQVEAGIARGARKNLVRAQGLVAAALLAFIAGTVVWAVAPQPSAKTLMVVERTTDDAICGTVVASEQGRLLLLPDGASEATVVPLAEVDAARVVAECPKP